MALKPETIARIQGILDGTIKVESSKPAEPASLAQLRPETRAMLLSQLTKEYDEVVAQDYAPIETQETPMPQQPDAQELAGADSVIEALATNGHGDYSTFRTEIALDIYTKGHYNGNSDVIFDPPEDSGLAGIRVIQEDEYDQSMSEDERPDEDDMVAEVNNGYLFLR